MLMYNPPPKKNIHEIQAVDPPLANAQQDVSAAKSQLREPPSAVPLEALDLPRAFRDGAVQVLGLMRRGGEAHFLKGLSVHVPLVF